MTLGPSEGGGLRRVPRAMRARRALLGAGLAAAVVWHMLPVMPRVAAATPGVDRPGQQAAASAPRVRVKIEALVTPRTGATGTPRVDVSQPLAVGERLVASIGAGQEQNPDFCDVGTLRPGSARRPHAVWTVDALVVAIERAQSTIQLAWTRSTTGPAGLEIRAQDVRTVRLASNESHIIDTLNADDRLAACASIVLRMAAEAITEPRMVPPLLRYELGLECGDTVGGRSTQRQDVLAPEHGNLPFFFAPGHWLPNGRLAEDRAGRMTVDMSVTGSIQVRPQADGSLAVSVRARRVASWGPGLVWGEGTAEYIAAPGERVTLPLPPPPGMVDVARTPAAELTGVLADGILLLPDTVRVDFARFFADRGCALQVSARHAR
jgi:hypothetical protein